MDSLVRIYMDRAENELRLARALVLLSEDIEMKKQAETETDDTFYSATISHAYYAIFYSAKALLLTKNIKTKAPEIHKNTIDAFSKEFVETGILDYEFLKIYKQISVTADELLNLFNKEKWKRGHVTYRTIAQANKPLADESVKNAKKFLQNIFTIIKKDNFVQTK